MQKRTISTHIGVWSPHLVLWMLIAVLVVPASGAGGFWWTDETRHAMGGLFVLDLIRDLPFGDPIGYAMRYFAQYPALALNWYLPGFYAVEAGFYAVFGASEVVAHWAVTVFCMLAASVWFAWVRQGWGAMVAFVAVAIVVTTPEWNFWTRSVMLEGPAIAMLIVAVWFFERYLDQPTWSRALWAGMVIAAALSVKQTVALLLPAVFAYGLWSSRRAALGRMQAIPAYFLVLVALAIVALHTVKFGNLGLAATVGDNRVDVGQSAARFSMERWLLYPEMLLRTWGLPLTCLTVIGAIMPSKGNEPRLPLLYAWLVCWYVAMSLLFGSADNAPRYTLYAFPVLAVFAARTLLLLERRHQLRNAALAAMFVLLGFNAYQAFAKPVPFVNGYREVAGFIHDRASRGPVLFAGKHDGSFIFHLRRMDEEREQVVLRADKVLVSLAVHKYFGMESHVRSRDEIRSLIKRYGIEYILIERPDILRVGEFEMLHELVQQPDFERVAVQAITTGGGADAPERIEVYRYREHEVAEDAEIVIPLPHMGREIRFRRTETH